MRLTDYTDYSLRVMLYLPCAARLATIQEISDAYGISKNHLMKVVQQLGELGWSTPSAVATAGCGCSRNRCNDRRRGRACDRE